MTSRLQNGRDIRPFPAENADNANHLRAGHPVWMVRIAFPGQNPETNNSGICADLSENLVN